MRRKFQDHHLKDEERIAQALAYIDSYIKENGYSPTVREIGAFMEVPSTSTMATAIDHMSAEGYLEDPVRFSHNGNRIARTLRITKTGRKLIKEHA